MERYLKDITIVANIWHLRMGTWLDCVVSLWSCAASTRILQGASVISAGTAIRRPRGVCLRPYSFSAVHGRTVRRDNLRMGLQPIRTPTTHRFTSARRPVITLIQWDASATVSLWSATGWSINGIIIIIIKHVKARNSVIVENVAR